MIGSLWQSCDLCLVLTVRCSSSSFGNTPDQTQAGLGAEGLSFYYLRLLCCPNQMLTVVLLSQHRVSSFKTVRPHAPRGTRCMGHDIRTWSAVYSAAPHSQFDEGVRPHLCMGEWNRPTPVLKRLSLTQAARDKPITTGQAPVLGTKAFLQVLLQAFFLEVFLQYSAFHL